MVANLLDGKMVLHPVHISLELVIIGFGQRNSVQFSIFTGRVRYGKAVGEATDCSCSVRRRFSILPRPLNPTANGRCDVRQLRVGPSIYQS